MYLRIQGFIAKHPKMSPAPRRPNALLCMAAMANNGAKLLLLWAYVDNQDIWFEFLRHGYSDYPEWIRELTVDEFNFNGAMSDHGLVEVDKFRGNGGYDIRGRGLCFEPRVI